MDSVIPSIVLDPMRGFRSVTVTCGGMKHHTFIRRTMGKCLMPSSDHEAVPSLSAHSKVCVWEHVFSEEGIKRSRIRGRVLARYHSGGQGLVCFIHRDLDIVQDKICAKQLVRHELFLSFTVYIYSTFIVYIWLQILFLFCTFPLVA